MSSGHQFTRHYTVAEAKALLPLVRGWLVEVRQLMTTLERGHGRNVELFAEGRDLGGGRINDLLRAQARLRELHGEFAARDLLLEDVERGRVGFPSLRGGQEVLLSWEEDDEDIEFWHEPGAGPAGRERI